MKFSNQSLDQLVYDFSFIEYVFLIEFKSISCFIFVFHIWFSISNRQKNEEKMKRRNNWKKIVKP